MKTYGALPARCRGTGLSWHPRVGAGLAGWNMVTRIGEGLAAPSPVAAKDWAEHGSGLLDYADLRSRCCKHLLMWSTLYSMLTGRSQ